MAIFMFAGKRIGLKQRWVMQESISAPQVGGIVRMTGFILKPLFDSKGSGPCFWPCGSARNLVLEEDFGTRCFTQCPRSAMRALILWE